MSDLVTVSEMSQIRVGEQIRFNPSHGAGFRWWTVRDRDDRFIVATVPAPFRPKGDLWYTIVDLTGWAEKTYNGAGGGIVRSSLNTLGGGWSLGPDGEGATGIIPALRSGEWELSHRRVVNVRNIQRRPCSLCKQVGGPYPRGDRPEGPALQSGCPRCGWCY